jgi:C1A family cysteine protease
MEGNRLAVGGIADAKTYPLGLNVTPAQMNATAKDIALASSKLTAYAYTYPTSWDWRSVKDKNWVTPIEDQKDCGACVAFAT